MPVSGYPDFMQTGGEDERQAGEETVQEGAHTDRRKDPGGVSRRKERTGRMDQPHNMSVEAGQEGEACLIS